MFADKRWLIPIFSLILLFYHHYTTLHQLWLINILVLIIFKSYKKSLISLIKNHHKLFFLAFFYQLFMLYFIPMELTSLLFHLTRFLSTLLFALMLNNLLQLYDIIASCELYLRPLQKEYLSADLSLMIILMRHYLTHLRHTWTNTEQVIRLRYVHKSSLYRWIKTITNFIEAILHYPSESVTILALRNYNQCFRTIAYPRKKSDILYFFLLCGILIIVSMY